MRALRFLVIAGFVAASGTAQAVYKCESDGKVSYSDTPCAGGKKLDVADAPATEAADARRRAAQEKRELARLEEARRKQQLQDERDRKKAAHARTSLERKCASLERRRKWAAEDAASAAGKSADKAKRKARRAEETFDAECKGVKLS